MYVCMHVCMCVCIHAGMHVCIHKHLQKLTTEHLAFIKLDIMGRYVDSFDTVSPKFIRWQVELQWKNDSTVFIFPYQRVIPCFDPTNETSTDWKTACSAFIWFQRKKQMDSWLDENLHRKIMGKPWWKTMAGRTPGLRASQKGRRRRQGALWSAFGNLICLEVHHVDLSIR